MTAKKPKHSEAVTQEKELGIRWGQSPKRDKTAPPKHSHALEKVIQAAFSHVQVNVRKKYFVANSISKATFVKRKISIGLERHFIAQIQLSVLHQTNSK